MAGDRIDRAVAPPEVDVATPRHDAERGRLHALGNAVGLALIALWVAWWAWSIRQDSMAMGAITRVEPLEILAGDFKVSVDPVARLHASGVAPYDLFPLYPYPPMIARVFTWVAWFDPATSATLWHAALGLLLAVGGIAAWRSRRALGLLEIPPALVVAAVLFSLPALFAMERGQADPLILVPLIASAWLLGRWGTWAEIAAGALLGASAWLKYYPGLAVVAPLALGRWKAVAAFVVVAGLIGVADRDGFRLSIRNGRTIVVEAKGNVPHVHDLKHSLVEGWGSIRFVRRSDLLRKIPAPVGAAILLAPIGLLVTRRFAKAADPARLTLPFLIWLASAATFAMPYSLDYNLACLPIAALCVWDRRDRWPVHVAMALSLAFWQPFAVPVGAQAMLLVKLAALYAVGASLAARAIGTEGEGVLRGPLALARIRGDGGGLVRGPRAGYARRIGDPGGGRIPGEAAGSRHA